MCAGKGEVVSNSITSESRRVGTEMLNVAGELAQRASISMERGASSGVAAGAPTGNHGWSPVGGRCAHPAQSSLSVLILRSCAGSAAITPPGPLPGALPQHQLALQTADTGCLFS